MKEESNDGGSGGPCTVFQSGFPRPHGGSFDGKGVSSFKILKGGKEGDGCVRVTDLSGRTTDWVIKYDVGFR